MFILFYRWYGLRRIGAFPTVFKEDAAGTAQYKPFCLIEHTEAKAKRWTTRVNLVLAKMMIRGLKECWISHRVVPCCCVVFQKTVLEARSHTVFTMVLSLLWLLWTSVWLYRYYISGQFYKCYHYSLPIGPRNLFCYCVVLCCVHAIFPAFMCRVVTHLILC